MLLDKIQGHPDFHTKISDNPVEMLKTIHMYMQDGLCLQLHTLTIKNALSRVLMCRQYHDEHVNDYVKRFKQIRNTLKELIGMKLLDYYYDSTNEYKAAPTKKALAKKNGWDLLMATILIDGSDKDKFGSLKKDLQSQFNCGNDQYPKTVKAVQEIHSKHCINEAYFEQCKQQNQ